MGPGETSPLGGDMKKGLAVFSLLVLLSVPATAAPRDDDGPRRGDGVIGRVVHVIKKLVGAVVPLEDGYVPVPPHP
jgi:hypothetical protein